MEKCSIVKCPKCGKEIKLDITQALDEDAEIWKCPDCNFIFRWVKS